MPTYEYACRDCAQHVEVVQSFADGPLTTCGVCGGQLRKVFSAAGIIFKGSGYYVNDSRSASRGGDRAKESESSSGSDKASGGSGEGKAASKGEGGGSGSSGKDSSGKDSPGKDKAGKDRAGTDKPASVGKSAPREAKSA